MTDGRVTSLPTLGSAACATTTGMTNVTARASEEASPQVRHKTSKAPDDTPGASVSAWDVSLVFAKQFLDTPVGNVLPPVQAFRKAGQKDRNAVAGTLGHLGRVDTGVEPRRQRRVA